MNENILSSETKTAIDLIENLPANDRKVIVEKLRDLIEEYEDEIGWDERFEKHPEPMLKLAEEALKEHAEGRSKPLDF